MHRLQRLGLVYLGTPYSKYKFGQTLAFIDAAKLAGALLKEGVRIYSPIAHTHPIAIHANIDPMNHEIWLPFDEALMKRADAMVIGTLDGWEDSYGVRYEIETFRSQAKPVFTVDPESLTVVELAE